MGGPSPSSGAGILLRKTATKKLSCWPAVSGVIHEYLIEWMGRAVDLAFHRECEKICLADFPPFLHTDAQSSSPKSSVTGPRNWSRRLGPGSRRRPPSAGLIKPRLSMRALFARVLTRLALNTCCSLLLRVEEPALRARLHLPVRERRHVYLQPELACGSRDSQPDPPIAEGGA